MISKRKNGVVGPIPGAGRKKEGNIAKNYRFTAAAVDILNKQSKPGQYASEAVLFYSKYQIENKDK